MSVPSQLVRQKTQQIINFNYHHFDKISTSLQLHISEHNSKVLDDDNMNMIIKMSCFYRLFWVSSLAYPNLLGIKDYVVVVVVVQCYLIKNLSR
jgi:hypothetical protein